MCRKLPTNTVSVDSNKCLYLQFKGSYTEVLENFEKLLQTKKIQFTILKKQKFVMPKNASKNEKSETKNLLNVETVKQVSSVQ